MCVNFQIHTGLSTKHWEVAIQTKIRSLKCFQLFQSIQSAVYKRKNKYMLDGHKVPLCFNTIDKRTDRWRSLLKYLVCEKTVLWKTSPRHSVYLLVSTVRSCRLSHRFYKAHMGMNRFPNPNIFILSLRHSIFHTYVNLQVFMYTFRNNCRRRLAQSYINMSKKRVSKTVPVGSGVWKCFAKMCSSITSTCPHRLQSASAKFCGITVQFKCFNRFPKWLSPCGQGFRITPLYFLRVCC